VAAKEFTKRTGTAIKVISTDDAGAALNRALLNAGSPEGDVFFGVDNTFLSRAQESDAFLPHRPTGLANVPRELQLDDSGRFTPIDEGSVCVDYDTEWFAEHQLDPPASLAALTDPRYRDLLLVEDPAASSPGLAFLAATHSASGDRTDQYWSALKANGVAVAASWDDAWNTRYTVNGGDRPLVVSYASSPPAEVVFSEPRIDAPRSGVIGSTCFRQVEFAAVLDGAAHPDSARLLVDEMLTEAWQSELPLSNFVYPARTSVKLPAEFDKWAQRPADPITIDAATIGAQRDDWITAWRNVME
jgi:thiamine transport system substrate-binding protein